MPKLSYIVAEVGPRTYIYDSRTGNSYDYFSKDFEGKRELLISYLEENRISDVVSIYEYALPSGRSQLVCWYRL